MAIRLFIYESTLKSDRPGVVPIVKSAMVGQQVLARLWEDPFEAVARHQDNESRDKSHEHSLKDCGKNSVNMKKQF